MEEVITINFTCFLFRWGSQKIVNYTRDLLSYFLCSASVSPRLLPVVCRIRKRTPCSDRWLQAAEPRRGVPSRRPGFGATPALTVRGTLSQRSGSHSAVLENGGNSGTFFQELR